MQIVDAAEYGSFRLKPSELASIPHVFQQPDGTSVSSPKASTVYSSERVFAAEDRLPAAAENHTAPTVLLAWIEQAARTENRDGYALSLDQEQAIAKIGISGRALDVLVGPVETGKLPPCKPSTVDAGGAFGMQLRERDDAPEL